MKRFAVQAADDSHSHVAAYTCRSSTAAAKMWAGDYGTFHVYVWAVTERFTPIRPRDAELFSLHLETPAIYSARKIRK